MEHGKLAAVGLAVIAVIIIWGVMFVLPGLNPDYKCCMQLCEKVEGNIEEFMVFTGVSIPGRITCEDYCKTITERFEGVFFDEETHECKEPAGSGGLI